MSKKTFVGGLNSILGEVKRKQGRPKTNFKEVTKTTQKGTIEGEARATFIINEELLDKLKAIAYWERLKIKDVLNRALEDEIARYEKKNGVVKPMPKTEKP